MYMCRTFRETILPRGEDKWTALRQKPRKSGSGRCLEVGDVGVESNWWTSLGSQAGVLESCFHFVSERTLPRSIWPAPWKCLGHSVECWIAKGRDLGVIAA